MKKILKLSLIISIFCLMVIPLAVGAQDPEVTVGGSLTGRLENVASEAGYNVDPAVASTPRIVGIIVGAFIGFSGLTFMVLMVVAGYGWMTSNGNEEKVKKAVATIKTSIIGLVVSLSAWVLWDFVFRALILG